MSEQEAGEEVGFHEWFDQNYFVLSRAEQTQTTDPPYKPIFIFAEGAWKYKSAKLMAAREEIERLKALLSDYECS